jgi:ribosomal protein S25
MKLHLIKNFKEICRLKLDSKLLNEIFEKVISFYGSETKFSFRFGTNWSTLYKYKTGRLYMPSMIVDKLLRLINEDSRFLFGKIEEIKFNNGSAFKVSDQRLEVNFNTNQGAKIIAALLGDGYNKSFNLGAGYVNKNPILRNEFLNNLTQLFECIELKDYSKAYNGKILQLPLFFSYVFEKAGIPCGKKVLINPGVPEWLLKTDNVEVIYAYLQQIFDDEGHISIEKRMIDLPQSIDVTEGKRIPKQLTDIMSLLNKIDIKSNSPYPVRNYEVKEGSKVYKRSKFVLTISNYTELKKFKDQVGFLSQHKQERLNKLVFAQSLIQRKNKQIEQDVLRTCKEFQSQKKVITSLLLANELGVGESYAQKLLKRLTEEGKLMKIKDVGILHKSTGDILRRTHAEFSIKGETNVV